MKFIQATFICLLLLFTTSCSPEEQEVLVEQEENAPIREAFQVRFVFSEMAEVKAALEAPHAIETTIGEESVQIFDRGVLMIFYNEEGEERSRLIADSAIFRNKFEQAEFWRNVVINNIGGEQVDAKRLHYVKGDSVSTMWAPLEVTPPTPIYRLNRALIKSGTLPNTIERNFNQKFGKQSDSLIVASVHHDLDSLMVMEEKTAGDTVLMEALRGTVDTFYTSPEINQVVVQTASELIYGDSLWALTDFSRYRIYKISGAVEMDEEL